MYTRRTLSNCLYTYAKSFDERSAYSNNATAKNKRSVSAFSHIITQGQKAGNNKPIMKYMISEKKQSGISRIGINWQKTSDKKYAETR